MAPQDQNKNYVMSTGRFAKMRVVILGFFGWFTLSATIVGYAYFETRTEIVSSAVNRVSSGPYPVDSMQVLEDLYQSVCKGSKTFSNCSVEAYQSDSLINSIPVIIGKTPIQLDRYSAIVNVFDPPLIIRFRFTPSPHFLFQSLAASLMVLIFIATAIALALVRLDKIKQEREVLLSRAQVQLGELASQVAHDIRSPLMALNMVLKSAESLPEDHRTLIRNATHRINCIADTLLKNSTKQLLNSFPAQSESPVVMAVEILEAVLNEKRVNFVGKAGLQLRGDLTQGYGRFVSMNATELSRIVSNLMNNAIESLKEQSGQVQLAVRISKSHLFVVISDNGCGIPEEVMNQIGTRGFSYGKKENGNGLGVHHARKSIASVGGKLKMQSKLGVGTIVTLEIPIAPTPDWFAEKITVHADHKVVSVDDDESVHDVWSRKLKSLGVESHQIEHEKFRSPAELIAFVQQGVTEQVTYLIDYEFLGSSENGLDLIEKYLPRRNAILVTSRSGESNVVNRASQLGIRVIAKSAVASAPLLLA